MWIQPESVPTTSIRASSAEAMQVSAEVKVITRKPFGSSLFTSSQMRSLPPSSMLAQACRLLPRKATSETGCVWNQVRSCSCMACAWSAASGISSKPSPSSGRELLTGSSLPAVRAFSTSKLQTSPSAVVMSAVRASGITWRWATWPLSRCSGLWVSSIASRSRCLRSWKTRCDAEPRSTALAAEAAAGSSLASNSQNLMEFPMCVVTTPLGVTAMLVMGCSFSALHA
mmetsp:Transcript_55151/g.145085  ORF Transcript_55151/g.145085 Transcript_55151/m.145085 type:complete len:228 (+) Transcript_55151:812-1495(+)